MTTTVPLNTVKITPKAAEKARYFAMKQGLSETFGVRVGVKGGGCSGLTYVLDLENDPGPDDKIIQQEGVQLFVHKKSFIFLAGTTLDFSDGLNGKGFVFENPNAKRTCGCGTSFGV